MASDGQARDKASAQGKRKLETADDSSKKQLRTAEQECAGRSHELRQGVSDLPNDRRCASTQTTESEACAACGHAGCDTFTKDRRCVSTQTCGIEDEKMARETCREAKRTFLDLLSDELKKVSVKIDTIERVLSLAKEVMSKLGITTDSRTLIGALASFISKVTSSIVDKFREASWFHTLGAGLKETLSNAVLSAGSLALDYMLS
ncbi:hypothetical protein MTO96_047322 [Rhipicephalus appendiculatus]